MQSALQGVDYQQLIIGFGLTAARPAGVFLMLPAFSRELVPATVRNSICLALGLVAILVNPLGIPPPAALPSIAYFFKEIFIGVAIGLFFSVILYALEVAGQIVDTVVGRSFATVVDPLNGHQSTLTGTYLKRLASFVFMFAGGLLLLVGVLMESYAIWPMNMPFPEVNAFSVRLFEAEYQRLMVLAVSFAAPALLSVFALDMTLGLVNRYAQQLNVFSLSLSLKAWISVFVIMTMTGLFARTVVSDAFERAEQVIDFLQSAI